MVSPRALLSKNVDHSCLCQHRKSADDSNLSVITAPYRYCRPYSNLDFGGSAKPTTGVSFLYSRGVHARLARCACRQAFVPPMRFGRYGSLSPSLSKHGKRVPAVKDLIIHEEASIYRIPARVADTDHAAFNVMLSVIIPQT